METALLEYLVERKIKNHTPSTIRTEKHILSNYVHSPINEWQSIFYTRALKNKAISSKRELVRLKTFSEWLIKKGLISHNPFKDTVSPKVEQPLPKSLTKEEVHKILLASGSIDLRAKAIFTTFLYTGIRRQELLNVQPHHVDLVNKALHIYLGKGNKSRMIPITDQLAFLLKEWGLKRPQHYYYFNMRSMTLRRLHERVQKSSGVEFTIHQLRHTFATNAIASGVDIYSLSKLLGHSDIKTTTVYLSASVDHLREQIEKLSF